MPILSPSFYIICIIHVPSSPFSFVSPPKDPSTSHAMCLPAPKDPVGSVTSSAHLAMSARLHPWPICPCQLGCILGPSAHVSSVASSAHLPMLHTRPLLASLCMCPHA